MSSSKVFSRFSVEAHPVPVGSEEFIDHFERERLSASPEELRFRQLEEQYQAEKLLAYQDGFRKGEAAGLQSGLSESRRVQAQLHAVISQLVDYERSLFRDSRSQLLELAFAIADKITRARGESEQQIVMETIHRCIDEILDKSRIRIKVNEQQFEFVKKNVDTLKQANEAVSHISVEIDSRVSVGGCIIETDSGYADARLESQLQALKEKLLAIGR